MTEQLVFKIMSGRGCLTSDKQTMFPSKEIRVVDQCHNHYSEVVERLTEEQKKRLYKELSDIYDIDDNYGKTVTVDIQYTVSLV